MINKFFLRTSALALLLTVTVGTANGAVRWVNDDDPNAGIYSPPGTSCDDPGYITIQAAVNAAIPGDNIKVCPGSYTENVVISTNDLMITATAGTLATVVNAAASAPVFYITSTGVTVQRFTILPAGFADGDLGVNLGVEGVTNVRILGNVIVGGRIGINLGCVSSGTTVAYNTVSAQTEAGVNIDTCEAPPFPGSHRNSIHHNTACSETSTGSIAVGGSSNYNSINHNTVTKIYLFGTGNNVNHNTTKVAIIDFGSNFLNNNTTGPGVCPAVPCPLVAP